MAGSAQIVIALHTTAAQRAVVIYASGEIDVFMAGTASGARYNRLPVIFIRPTALVALGAVGDNGREFPLPPVILGGSVTPYGVGAIVDGFIRDGGGIVP